MKKIILAGVIIIIGFTCPTWAAEIIAVKDVNNYFPTRNFNYSGPEPYLSYFNIDQKISAEAHAAAKKFKTDNAVLDIAANANEPVRQINFTATICNPWQKGGGMDLKPELISLKDEKKELLQQQVIEAAKNLFDIDITKTDFASIKQGEEISTSAFVLAYNEYPAKCDTNGGDCIY
jgi:hypothetical protein